MNYRNNSKIDCKNIFAIHGGGNIGLGLMADIVSRSSVDYKIIASSNDKLLKKIINSTHQLCLQHNTNANNITKIRDVTIVSRKFRDIVDLYKKASMLAICLTPNALLDSVKAIAQGLIERYDTRKSNLNILVLMNLPNCGEIVAKTILRGIVSLGKNLEQAQKIFNSITLIPTVVDRIVTKIPESAIKKSDLPCRLFNAEKNFALYVSDQAAKKLPFTSIIPVSNIRRVEAIKNKYINGPHAMMAWLGALFGFKTIAEAIRSSEIKKFVEDMMDQEIAPILMIEYEDLTVRELLEFKKLFFKRCEESDDDLVLRVGRDPLRKINMGERLRGTIELHRLHHLSTPVHRLECAISAAILYSIKKLDAENPECMQIFDIYQKNKSYIDVLTYHGGCDSGQFQGFNLWQDAKSIKNIVTYIIALDKLSTTQKHFQQSFLTSIRRHILLQENQ